MHICTSKSLHVPRCATRTFTCEESQSSPAWNNNLHLRAKKILTRVEQQSSPASYKNPHLRGITNLTCELQQSSPRGTRIVTSWDKNSHLSTIKILTFAECRILTFAQTEPSHLWRVRILHICRGVRNICGVRMVTFQQESSRFSHLCNKTLHICACRRT